MNNNLTPSKRKTSGEQILTPITPNKTAKKQNSEEQLIKRRRQNLPSPPECDCAYFACKRKRGDESDDEENDG